MFDETIRAMLIEGTWATLYMTLISTLFGYISVSIYVLELLLFKSCYCVILHIGIHKHIIILN